MNKNRALGSVLIFEVVLSFVPVVVLGAAIGWPASLSLPAQQVLPLVQAHLPEVRLGYGFYLLYSILFFPLVIGAAQSVGPRNAWGTGLRIAAGLAAASTLARGIGIVRWLSIPAGVDPGVFDAVNSYGGTIGEALGIGIFGGGAVLAFSLALLSRPEAPRWLSWWGLVVAAAQGATVAELFGIDAGPATTIAALALISWFLVLGLHFLVTGRGLGTSSDDAAEGLGGQSQVRGDHVLGNALK